MQTSTLTLLALMLVGFAFASLDAPVYPMGGSYSFTTSAGHKGRVAWDQAQGLHLVESDGVTTLLDSETGFLTVSSATSCKSNQLSVSTIPTANHWSHFTLSTLEEVPESLASAHFWTDGEGSGVFTDCDTGVVVALTVVEDEETLFVFVSDWNTSVPADSAFVVPTPTISLCQSNEEEAVTVETLNVHSMAALIQWKCPTCKLAIGVLGGRLCSIGGALACSPVPPSVPFCAVLASFFCKRGVSFSKEKACKIIRLC